MDSHLRDLDMSLAAEHLNILSMPVMMSFPSESASDNTPILYTKAAWHRNNISIEGGETLFGDLLSAHGNTHGRQEGDKAQVK